MKSRVSGSGLESQCRFSNTVVKHVVHQFEAILFGEQKPECPQCHTDKLEKQLSTFAVSKGAARPRQPAGCGQTNCCMMNGGGCAEN